MVKRRKMAHNKVQKIEHGQIPNKMVKTHLNA